MPKRLKKRIEAGESIDHDRLRAALRRLDNQSLYRMLVDAIEMLPPSKLARLAGDYLDLDLVRAIEADGAKDLASRVKAFEKASLAGEYYERFDVNSKHFMETSAGTNAWISECRLLLNACVTATGSIDPAANREAFETLFGLLQHVDECLDDVVFFADEGGSWQIGVDWSKVLPAWCACLSGTTEPTEYAARVINVVDRLIGYRRDDFLKMAARKATPNQRKALKAVASGGG